MKALKLFGLALGLALSSVILAQAQIADGTDAAAAEIEDGGYYLAVSTSLGFEAAKEQAIELLKTEGFGVLTEVDIQAKLKEKLDADIPPLVILGVCNPPAAYQALQAEDWIATMMPCSLVVKQLEDGSVMVGVQNPGMLAMATGNDDLTDLGAELKAKLERVLVQLAE